MVDAKTVQKQLKAIKFGGTIWNQAELRELPHILHEHETIEECVNGMYEGGVALLVATDSRLLLIDKKPLNFLTVEDLRFDMINEIDYSHRLMGATITISTGSKTLRFSSMNQPRLRRLITTVQERMSLIKKEHSDKADTQQQHLEEINKQLQMYLLAQHQQIQQQMTNAQAAPIQQLDLPKPDPRLADYLFSQRLMEQFQKDGRPAAQAAQVVSDPIDVQPEPEQAKPVQAEPATQAQMVDDARQEVFGRHVERTEEQVKAAARREDQSATAYFKGLEVNPLRIAYSKLPMMLRNRKFGRPSFHAHSQQPEKPARPVMSTSTPR